MDITQYWQVIIVALISSFVTIIFLSLLSSIRNALIWITKRLFYAAVVFPGFERKYRNYIINREGMLPIQGILSQSYIELRLHTIFVPPRLIAKQYAHGKEDVVTSLSIEEAISSSGNKIVILGDPGSGKTTLLKYIATDAAIAKKILPIIIQLRELGTNSSADILSEHLSNLPFASDIPRHYFERKLQKGDCIILMDGLDEISETERAWVVDQIVQLSFKYPNNTYIVSSRTASYTIKLPDFSLFVLSEFNDNEIAECINKWSLGIQLKLQSDTTKAREIAQKRSRELLNIVNSFPGIRQLAGNPFLLTLILITHFYSAKLPTRRVGLLNEVLQIMLEVWDLAKGIQSPKFARSMKTSALELLALKMQEQNVWSLPRRTVEELLIEFSSSLGLREDQIDDFLNEVITRTGLLVESQHGYIGFSHKIFQEYSAAMSITKDHSKEIMQLYKDNHRWAESIVLYAGLIPDASNLLREIMGGEKPIKSQNLILAGRCLVEANEVDVSLRDNIVESLRKLSGTDPSIYRVATSILIALGEEGYE